MSVAAGLDIRVPIGALFTALGLLIGGYGLVAPESSAGHGAAGININLWWGLVMLVFGVLMLLGSRRHPGTAAQHPAGTTPEGQLTERREKVLGLEK